jgi:hypothetical protein
MRCPLCGGATYAPGTATTMVRCGRGCNVPLAPAPREGWRQRIAGRLADAIAFVSKAVGQ